MPAPITENTLFYGDNLLILREYIADESVDLIYLDPHFNSQRGKTGVCDPGRTDAPDEQRGGVGRFLPFAGVKSGLPEDTDSDYPATAGRGDGADAADEHDIQAGAAGEGGGDAAAGVV